jgi:hypothetical protein
MIRFFFAAREHERTGKTYYLHVPAIDYGPAVDGVQDIFFLVMCHIVYDIL